MSRYADVEVTGPARQQALERIFRQMREWGLTMPAGEPLVLDFGLGRFEQIGETEFWIANEVEIGYCGKFLFLFDGQTCPHHRHQMKHETFFIVKGAVRMRVEEGERLLREGEVLAMPPGTGHSFTAAAGPALVLEVSQPSVRGDNFFDDPQTGEGGVL